MDNPLLTLCDAASMLEEQDAYASQRQSPVTEGTHGKSNGTEIARKFIETYQAKVKITADNDLKPHLPKLPNHLFADYIENTSDELSKRFSFKCRYSPDTCSEVVESYGSEVKALTDIKQHIYNHHFLKSSLNDLKSINELTSTSKSSKSSSSVKTGRVISEKGSNRRKSVKQKSTDKEESVNAPLETHFEVDDSKDFNITNTLKLGQFEHDYAKREKEPSAGNPPARRNKTQRWNATQVLRDFKRYFDSELSSTPAVIPTAPFPFVHTPEPPEPAQIVELHSNGDPVDYIGQIFVQSSTSRISTKKTVKNEMSRKKSKFARVVSASRSVLECVENRVACKPSCSSVQRNALEPDNSIENDENVDKKIVDREIAWRNIQKLSQKRRRRKNHNQQSDFVCEICDRKLTANTSLTHHYMSHLNMKPFKCSLCRKTFTRRHSLNYHLMIHNNITRFTCSTCKRAFRHPSHFKEHMRKHTGEAPFSCKFCTNNFKTRNSFKRHLKMQHQKILTSNGIVSIDNSS